MSETAIALNEASLLEVAGMSMSEDTGGGQSLPVLKINYDGESAYPAGAWVVGQKKDQKENIIEEGSKVKGVIILAVRNRYSFYNQADNTKNCNSPIHNQGDKVYGSRYGHQCGKTCPLRDSAADPRCQAQKVVYGIALTEDNQLVECVSYLKGSNYMPFSEYVEQMVKVKSGAKYVTVPPFAFITLLGSEKKKNGGVVYYVGQYTRGPSYTLDQIRSFDAKRKEVLSYIDNLNSAIIEESTKARALLSGGKHGGIPTSDGTPMFRSDPPDDAYADAPPPWETAKEIEPAVFSPSAGESTPANDIEAVIAKAIAGLK